MPTESDFDKLLDESPRPSSWELGWPWKQQFVFEGGDEPAYHMGRQTVSENKAELHGPIKVDGSTSVQKNIAGPLVEHDAPTGLTPSTLFTPFPRDTLGIDNDYFELLALAAMATVFGAIAIGVANA